MVHWCTDSIKTLDLYDLVKNFVQFSKKNAYTSKTFDNSPDYINIQSFGISL